MHRARHSRRSGSAGRLPALVALLGLFAAGAQAARQEATGGARAFRSSVELTSITATVFDRDGRLVAGLTRDAFDVY